MDKENAEDFFTEVLGNWRDVCRATQLAESGNLEPDEIDIRVRGICWNITEMLMHMLADGDEVSMLVSMNKRNGTFRNVPSGELISYLLNALNGSLLLLFIQDSTDQDMNTMGQDHHFALISSGMDVYWVERTELSAISVEKFSRSDAVLLLIMIKIGYKPDRMYGKKAKHTFDIYSFNRKKMSGKVVRDFIGV